jgi:hypothetical protein
MSELYYQFVYVVPMHYVAQKIVHKFIILLCILASVLITLNPLWDKVQLIDNQEFSNGLVVFLANFGVVVACIYVGGLIGSKVVKLFF